jgi:hypothetical protein
MRWIARIANKKIWQILGDRKAHLRGCARFKADLRN